MLEGATETTKSARNLTASASRPNRAQVRVHCVVAGQEEKRVEGTETDDKRPMNQVTPGSTVAGNA